MYYEDLTNSIDNKGEPEPNTYMVGWLDEKHEFPKGKVTPFILERVLSLCFVPIRQTRGFHQRIHLLSVTQSNIKENTCV